MKQTGLERVFFFGLIATVIPLGSGLIALVGRHPAEVGVRSPLTIFVLFASLDVHASYWLFVLVDRQDVSALDILANDFVVPVLFQVFPGNELEGCATTFPTRLVAQDVRHQAKLVDDLLARIAFDGDDGSRGYFDLHGDLHG